MWVDSGERLAASERWLITGACGQLGAHVMAALEGPTGCDGRAVVGLARRKCAERHGGVIAVDVRHASALGECLAAYRPTHVVHLATVRSPWVAEIAPADAWALSVGVTEQLAEYASATGAWMLYASTDFVWDGRSERRYREADTPMPATVYGSAKLAGERVVLSRHVGAVARFSLLCGAPVCPRETTWTRLLDALRHEAAIPACVDEYRTPLTFTDAARVVLGLARIERRGLVHVAGPDVLTPDGLVRRFADAMGVVPRIQRISRRSLPGGDMRPRNVAMDASLLLRLLPDCRPRQLLPAMRRRPVPQSVIRGSGPIYER